MLQVKIAEVSRSLIRNIGVNLANRDNSGGFLLGLFRGNPGSISTHPGPGIDPTSGALMGDTRFGFQAVDQRALRDGHPCRDRRPIEAIAIPGAGHGREPKIE